ncbi:MAG: c-type cytochrome [Legionellales bacterium]|nr:c-type cytochrome [Legionellales bacterium]
MRIWLFFVSFLTVTASYAAPDFDRDQIQDRVSPIGKVHLAGATDPAPAAPVAASEQVKKSPGEATYDQYCVICHRDGVAGAPKVHEKADWGPRLDKKNIDALTASALKGLNAMPPKGTCQSCSDADIKAAIEYMVPPK